MKEIKDRVKGKGKGLTGDHGKQECHRGGETGDTLRRKKVLCGNTSWKEALKKHARLWKCHSAGGKRYNMGVRKGRRNKCKKKERR